jgi:hypothetical protein
LPEPFWKDIKYLTLESQGHRRKYELFGLRFGPIRRLTEEELDEKYD